MVDPGIRLRRSTSVQPRRVTAPVSAPKPPAQAILRAIAPRTSSTTSRSTTSSRSSGGGYGGGYSGGGGAAVSYNVPPPVAQQPQDIEAWLAGDTGWNEQRAAIERALRDYITQYDTSLANYKTEHTARENELGIARQRGLTDLENDFAGRGLLTSGLYAGDVSELSGDFDRQASELARALAEYQSNLAMGRQNFETEQQLTLQRARQEAIARRAATYGL